MTALVRALPLRLEGPMQAWGGPVAGDDRPTLEAPTKSGVLGLVAGALGLDRADTIAIHALHRALLFAVRLERPGSAGVDFQTIEQVPTAEGGTRRDPIVSRRGYLYDASFTALLVPRRPSESLPATLEQLAHALRFPVCLPFLGRRACPLACPAWISPGVHEGPSWQSILLGIAPSRSDGLEHSFEIQADAELVDSTFPSPVVERRVRDVPSADRPRYFHERAVRLTTQGPRNTTEGWGV